jgi:serine phosphatase RsbU (regulator of sigma subunit)
LVRATPRTVDPACTLDDTGLPIGILDDQTYPATTIPLRPGDGLVLYSDGVTDAMNPAGDRFGTEAVREVLAKEGTAPHTAGDTLRQAILAHTGDCPQFDDLTLVAVWRVA